VRTFAILLRRDLAILLPGGARGSAFLPLIFFLLVAVLFPFAVGPEPTLLARTGGGVLWIATLLASILPLDRLVAADREAGVFDQLRLRGISEEVAMTARLIAHWLCFAPLMILATLPAAALLSLSGETLARLVVSHAGPRRHRPDYRRAARKLARWHCACRFVAGPDCGAAGDFRRRTPGARGPIRCALCGGLQPGAMRHRPLRRRCRNQGGAGLEGARARQ